MRPKKPGFKMSELIDCMAGTAAPPVRRSKARIAKFENTKNNPASMALDMASPPTNKMKGDIGKKDSRFMMTFP